MTSVHLCVQSIVNLRAAFDNLLEEGEDVISNSAVARLLRDLRFWEDIIVLEKALSPFSKVIMAIQARASTLADVTRYMIYLSLVLQRFLELRSLPTGILTRRSTDAKIY
jgi:hypothetical protein